eukprot:TRINITY_DN56631_c0_g1_i1.p1 TRINITY_DN56631_c0_g1~~TRINITY_DN56631_c0_g1_i1.p1  ORF type:complete len:376 (+),score=70.79 TRINITY_DN56631_c0_g1_i1:53-1180(+)
MDVAKDNADADSKTALEKLLIRDAKGENVTEADMMAAIRILYEKLPIFLSKLSLRRAPKDCYLSAQILVDAFLDSCGANPETKVGKRLSKVSGRAVQTSLLEQFGTDLPRVYLGQQHCAGFAVESDDFPAKQLKDDPSEVQAARAIRKEQRLQDGDLAFRPLAEQGLCSAGYGSKVHEKTASVDELKGGSSRYLSELLSLGCAPELLKLKLYPDAKELTESFAAFNAFRTYLSASFSTEDPSVTVICVGDGSLPRTAALFAFRTKWQCYAVDPQMREESNDWRGVNRCHAMCSKIEDCKFQAEKLLIVCVHAHVGLQECLDVVEAKTALGIVVMPCCNFYSRLQLFSPAVKPLAEYHDSGVVSPHRLIRVYSIPK